MSVWGEQLDAAKTGEQFGAVLGRLFAAAQEVINHYSGDDTKEDEDAL